METDLRQESRAALAAIWPLRIAVVGICVGYSVRILRHGLAGGDAGGGFEIIVVTILFGVVPFVFIRQARHLLLAVLVWMEVTLVTETSISTWYPWHVPLGMGARVAAPLALFLLLGVRPPERWVLWILRIGAAATFFGHGCEALLLNDSFFPFIAGPAYHILGLQLEPATTEILLRAIGIVDIAVSVLILLPRSKRAAAAYMTVWGLATASVRTISGGWAEYPETLYRLAHGAVPLALLLYWHVKERVPDAATR